MVVVRVGAVVRSCTASGGVLRSGVVVRFIVNGRVELLMVRLLVKDKISQHHS